MIKNKRKYIIGIDEVGRGALAGPVVVAAVSLPRGFRPPRRLGKLRDSKKLSPAQRERWFSYFISYPLFEYAVARVYSRGIERMNISNAANWAATRAYTRLMANGKWLMADSRVFLDGGLFLQRKSASSQRWSARTRVRADEKITAVKAASIVAKVSRDRYMEKLARKHSNYGFEIHKGYGTRRHRAAILRYGPSQVHRLTFLKKYPSMQRANGL